MKCLKCYRIDNVNTFVPNIYYKCDLYGILLCDNCICSRCKKKKHDGKLLTHEHLLGQRLYKCVFCSTSLKK